VVAFMFLINNMTTSENKKYSYAVFSFNHYVLEKLENGKTVKNGEKCYNRPN